MIDSKYDRAEGNSEVSKILDRMLYEYRKSLNVEGSSCCRISLNGAVFVRSYREFVNILESCRVVFILITTTYCPYCMLFKPIFYSIAENYSDRAAFIEVNADYIPEIAAMFNIYSTPTTIILIDGRVADEIMGYMPANYFKGYVDSVLRNVKCIQR